MRIERPSRAELRNGPITIEVWGETRVYSLIKASSARNHDGSYAGWKPGTPEGDRECIQVEIHPERGPVYYQNLW